VSVMSEEPDKNVKDQPETPDDRGSPDNKLRPDRPSLPGGPMRFSRGGLGWLVLLGVVLAMVWLLNRNYTKPTELTIDEFFVKLENKEIAEITLSENSIRGKLRTVSGQPAGSSDQFKVNWSPHAMDWQFIKDLNKTCTETGTTFRHSPSDNIFIQVFLNLLPWLLIFVFIWFFVFRQLRNTTGGAGMLGSFGRSRHRLLTKERPDITFDDVAGVEEAKDEVTEIIEFLKNPMKFRRLGGRIPRGVLLIGEPGCGKTLLAKAIAGEADVPFFSISGSDFVEMFVGVGASRVRDLFAQAKTNSPCIIFLDEIDAVGRKRGVGFNSGGHDEREQTLNAILVEIDGFDTSDQVIVIAATNRPDVLDPALTRPGRFDRQVYVPLPDIKGRHEILKVHVRNVKLSPEVDLMKLARGTPMFSGADLEAIINEAAISATMANKEYVEMEDLEEARDKVRWGRAKKSRVIDDREKKVIAYHEAGHALASELVPETDPVHKVSVIPRAQAGGMTMMLPETDRHIYTRRFVLANLQVLLAGRVAEELACDDISSGAADDIKRASQLARTMVCDWGMSERVGPVKFGTDLPGPWPGELGGKEYSEETARTIDAEIQKLTRDAFEEVKRLLSENRDKLDRLAEALLKYETLDSEDVQRIIRGQPISKPTVGDLIDDVAQQVDEVKDVVSLGTESADERHSRPGTQQA